MSKLVKLILSILLCQSVGIMGSIFTVSGLVWYETLQKPAFTPPNMVFGPVWTTLYTLAGISLYLVLQKETKQKKLTALIFFGILLIMNPVWIFSFFTLQNLPLALGVIFTIDLLAIITTYLFAKISKDSAILFIPYIYWILFATALNFVVWQLN